MSPVKVDIYGNRFNVQLEGFFSWRPDPDTMRVDTFAQDWKRLRLYAFPPFAEIQKVSVGKEDMETMALATPLWRSQA